MSENDVAIPLVGESVSENDVAIPLVWESVSENDIAAVSYTHLTLPTKVNV